MEKKQPLRQCIGCGEKKPKSELARILRTPEGAIVYDATGRGNGRGAYLCRDVQCLQKARKKQALSRSFQQKIEDEVYETIEESMVREQEER
jgi:predicted RNA-binding protein YlxR (DUF448 family)